MNDSNDISLADVLSGCAYSVRKSDLEKAARLMAAAFHDDPSIRYLLGGRTQGRDDWRYFLAALHSILKRTRRSIHGYTCTSASRRRMSQQFPIRI